MSTLTIFPGRDYLVGGGLFLIRSSVVEIHDKIEGSHDGQVRASKATFSGVIFQIAVLDIIFSLDSVITAVGMAEAIWVMIAAVIAAVAVMMVFAGAVSAVRFSRIRRSKCSR